MKILIWLFAALVFSLGSSTAMYASDPATGSVCVILFGVFAFWIARTLCKAHDKSKNNSSAENTFVAYSSEPVYFSENILSAPLTENNNVLFASSDEIIDTTKTDGTVSKSPKPHKTVPLYLFVISCLLLVSSLSLFSWQFFEKQKLQKQITTLSAENSNLSQQIDSLSMDNSALRQKNAIFSGKVSQLEMQNNTLSQSNNELSKTITYFADRVVFVYGDGKAYHSYECSFIQNKPVTPLTFLDVANSDYVPCPLCSANTYDSISIIKLLLESPFDNKP